MRERLVPALPREGRMGGSAAGSSSSLRTSLPTCASAASGSGEFTKNSPDHFKQTQAFLRGPSGGGQRSCASGSRTPGGSCLGRT